jgi:ATP-dependent Clp protease ATP-binding subunit ClpB
VSQRRLQDPLAQLLLEGRILDGSKVKASVGKKGLSINGIEFATADDDFEAEHTPQSSRAVH